MEELSIEQLYNFLKSHSSGRINISFEIHLNHVLSTQVILPPKRGKLVLRSQKKKNLDTIVTCGPPNSTLPKNLIP